MVADERTYSITVNGSDPQSAKLETVVLHHECDNANNQHAQCGVINVPSEANQAPLFDATPPLEQPSTGFRSVPPPWCFAPMDGCPLCMQHPTFTSPTTLMPAPYFSSLSPYNVTPAFATPPASNTTASNCITAMAPSPYSHSAGRGANNVAPSRVDAGPCSACPNFANATSSAFCPHARSTTFCPTPPTLVPTPPYPGFHSVGAAAPTGFSHAESASCPRPPTMVPTPPYPRHPDVGAKTSHTYPPTGCVTANVRSPNDPMCYSCPASAHVSTAPPLTSAGNVVPVCPGTSPHFGAPSSPATFSPPSFPIAHHVVSSLRSAMPSYAHGAAPNEMPASSAAYPTACRNGGRYQAKQPIFNVGPLGLPNECHADGRPQVKTRMIAGADFSGGAFGAGGNLTDEQAFYPKPMVPATIVGTTTVPARSSPTAGREESKALDRQTALCVR